MYIKLAGGAAFWFSEDIELLHAAEGILRGADRAVYKIFGDLAALRRKYRLAAEIYSSPADGTVDASVFECLQGFDAENFTPAAFREHVLALDDLPGVLLDRPGCSVDDGAEMFASYIAASAFFSRTKDFVNDIFSLAEDLRTAAFSATVKAYEARVNAALESARAELAAVDPLAYSDKIMNKHMFHRGPYDLHVFAPSIFLPWRHVRYIVRPDYGTQFLFYVLTDAAFDGADLLRQLKALGDDARFKIMVMIKEYGHLRGAEIARAMNLTAATVSHHMRVLREAGLLHEEVAGNARVYSVPTNIAQMLGDGLNKFFK